METRVVRPRISRRNFVLRCAAVAPAASLAGLLLPPVTRGTTSALAAQSSDTPLHVMSWSYHPEMVQENLEHYAEVYGEPVPFYEQSPSGSVYADLLTAKFMGGEALDLAYVDEFYANRLFKAGYLATLDEFPEAEEIKNGVYDVGLTSMTSSEGDLIGLPYWSGPQTLAMHAGHMDQAGFQAPETWEEFVDQCEQLKGEGISAYPFLPQWVKSSGQLDWTLYAELYSEGEYLFDDELNPTFQDGEVFQQTLTRWKYLWDNGLVPQDVFTVPNEGITAYASGQHTFHWTHEYDLKVFNDPEQSQMAGMAKAIEYPGAADTTFVDSALYSMGAKNNGPDRAWTLLRWFGWKDPKTNEFEVNKRWAIDFGLGTVIKELAEDPEVIAAWEQWKDVDLYQKQMEQGRARMEMKQLWYNEWNEFMMGQVQDAITGTTDIGQAITAIHDKAMTLKEAYPRV